MSIHLLESVDHERMASLITHIQFEGEFHSLTFALHGILLAKGELMQVLIFLDQMRYLFFNCAFVVFKLGLNHNIKFMNDVIYFVTLAF